MGAKEQSGRTLVFFSPDSRDSHVTSARRSESVIGKGARGASTRGESQTLGGARYEQREGVRGRPKAAGRLTQKLPSPALKEAERSGSYNPGDHGRNCTERHRARTNSETSNVRRALRIYVDLRGYAQGKQGDDTAGRPKRVHSKKEEHNWGVVGTHSNKRRMATSGSGPPSAKEPKEDQTGVSATVGGSLPAGGRDMGATTVTSDTARAGGARAAREGALQQRGEAHRAALMDQAEEAAAKLKGLMAELAGTWVSPLAETEPRVVALAARLVPAAECLETVRENLASTAAQPDSAREQMLQAEAHLSFAQLHMAAAQKFQTPAEEMVAPSNTPSIPAGAQLVRALTEARALEAAASALQASWTREALRRTACVSYVALEACEMAMQTSWNPRKSGTYYDLLDREGRRLDEAFGSMMPDELPGAVVAAGEVWLDDACDNFTMAQVYLAMRWQLEEERVVALEEHPEPPDGETSAEKARRLWIPRAFSKPHTSHTWRRRYAMTPPRPTGAPGRTKNTGGCSMKK